MQPHILVMGSDKKYRWEKRRERKARSEKAFKIGPLDWVTLTLIWVMFFITLRLFFIFEVTSAPCAEMIMTLGQSSGLPPIFKLTYWISLLIAAYWLCITVHRAIKRQASWALISWHIILFLSIFFLAVANRNLTASEYIKPPDGIMVVENKWPLILMTVLTWSGPKTWRKNSCLKGSLLKYWNLINCTVL